MRTGQYPAKRITVPTNVFCSGLHGHVNTQDNGLLIERRTIAVIDQRNDLMLPGQLSQPR